jgi:hypothetical protein
VSQRLRGVPSRKSNVPRVASAVALLAGALWLGSVLAAGDDGDPQGKRGQKRAERRVEQPVEPPTAKEIRRAEEKERRRRAQDGRVGVFDGAGQGGETHGNAGRLVTYSVATEEATGVRPGNFAHDVDRALSDPRSWTAAGALRFERVEDGHAAVRVVLATPATVDELCLPLETIGRFSCRQGSQLNINLDRWLNGTDEWPRSVAAYRNHVINHEMGHFLGNGHVSCPSEGARAPVMMQQTKDLDGCKPNPWPHPDAKRKG